MEITLPGPGGTQLLPGRWADSASESNWNIDAGFGGGFIEGTTFSTVDGYRDFKTLNTWQVRTWFLDFGGGDTITVVAYMKGKISRWCGKFNVMKYCTATAFVPNCNWYITDGTGVYENLQGYGKYDLELGQHIGTGYYSTD